MTTYRGALAAHKSRVEEGQTVGGASVGGLLITGEVHGAGVGGWVAWKVAGASGSEWPE